MGACKKSYTLTAEQEGNVKTLVEGIRSKHSTYDFIVCESSFDAGVYFEPTEKELQEIEADD